MEELVAEAIRYNRGVRTVYTGYSTYRLEYHICWVTKYRRRILNPGIQSYIRKLFPKLVRQMPGVEIHSVGMELDHIHLIMTIPPKYCISEVVSRLKTQLTSNLRKKFSWLDKVYWKENIVWSNGYFISSIGLDEKTINNYVKFQGAKDSGQMELNL